MVKQAQKIELSESEWIENESIDRLMKTRRGTIAFASLASFLMALQLVGYIHTALILIWLTASLLFIFYRFNLKNKITKDLRTATVAVKAGFVKKYSFIWNLNAFIWGLASWLFIANMPVQNQYVCATILNGVGFVAVLNLSSHRKIARQYINTLMGTYIVACLWQIGVVENFNSPLVEYAHLISLLFIWLFLHMLDNRNYAAYKNNLSLLYRNNQLIHSLNLKTEQLATEKQMAVNSNEVTKRFYANAAQDIQQPVGALKIYIDLAMQDETKLAELFPKMRASCSAVEDLLSSAFNVHTRNNSAASAFAASISASSSAYATSSAYIPVAKSNNVDIDIDIDINNIPNSRATNTQPRVLAVDFDLN